MAKKWFHNGKYKILFEKRFFTFCFSIESVINYLQLMAFSDSVNNGFFSILYSTGYMHNAHAYIQCSIYIKYILPLGIFFGKHYLPGNEGVSGDRII